MSDSPVDIQWKNVSQKIPAQNSVCLIENGELVIRRGGVNHWRWFSLLSGEEYSFENFPKWVLMSSLCQKKKEKLPKNEQA